MASHGLKGRRRRRRKGKEPKDVGRLFWDVTESWGGSILIRSFLLFILCNID